MQSLSVQELNIVYLVNHSQEQVFFRYDWSFGFVVTPYTSASHNDKELAKNEACKKEFKSEMPKGSFPFVPPPPQLSGRILFAHPPNARVIFLIMIFYLMARALKLGGGGA